MNVWQEAIDYELVIANIGIAGDVSLDEAKKTLSELIQYYIDVATDPRVNGGRSLQYAQETGPGYTECEEGWGFMCDSQS